MDIAASIVAVIILILLFLLYRRTQATTTKRPPLPSRPGKAKPDSQFHAVSLKFPASACDAAKAMEGKRFLSSAAPRIPLAECDSLECKCRFIHHKDRRESDDRRNPYRATIAGDTGEHKREQRHRGERRGDDPDDFFS